MPSAFAHAAVGAALVAAAPPAHRRPLIAVAAAALAAAPDLDVIGFWFGIPYSHPLGHRGLTHSIPFAIGVGVFVRITWRGPRALALALLMACACASHGLLDALTNAGLGVGLAIPFWNDRYFFPWRPILTSSLDPRDAFSRRGLEILLNEARWIGLATLAWLSVVLGARKLVDRQPR